MGNFCFCFGSARSCRRFRKGFWHPGAISNLELVTGTTDRFLSSSSGCQPPHNWATSLGKLDLQPPHWSKVPRSKNWHYCGWPKISSTRTRREGKGTQELRRELPLHLKGSTGVAAVPGSNRIVNPVCTGTPFNISFGVTGTAGWRYRTKNPPKIKKVIQFREK